LEETQRKEDQLAGLVAERRVLVEQAGYPLDDPVVRDLDALIHAAQEQQQPPASSSSPPE